MKQPYSLEAERFEQSKKYQVTDVKTVKEFVTKYEKPAASPAELQQSIEWHIKTLLNRGYTMLGARESISGKPVSLYLDTIDKKAEEARKFIDDHFEFIVVR